MATLQDNEGLRVMRCGEDRRRTRRGRERGCASEYMHVCVEVRGKDDALSQRSDSVDEESHPTDP